MAAWTMLKRRVSGVGVGCYGWSWPVMSKVGLLSVATAAGKGKIQADGTGPIVERVYRRMATPGFTPSTSFSLRTTKDPLTITWLIPSE